MRKNFGAKPWIYPMPVLIISAYDENGKANAMNAAWGGIADTNRIAICLSAEHKTVKNILLHRAFIVSMADEAHLKEADYVGIVSGNQEADKMEKARLHTTESEFVHAPLIDELPMALECTLISYDEESELMIGEIVNVCADECILGEDGKIDPDKLAPITFDPIHHVYRKLGNPVGKAFKDGLTLKEKGKDI